MNPEDAAARGIKNGDIVKVYNDRGYAHIKAIIHNGTPSGMLVSPKGYQVWEYIEGHLSDLTSNFTHPALYNNYPFDVLCQVEKL
jgi:molybdopterin-containing oxidoreductase family molybdopterin binding subunit